MPLGDCFFHDKSLFYKICVYLVIGIILGGCGIGVYLLRS